MPDRKPLTLGAAQRVPADLFELVGRCSDVLQEELRDSRYRQPLLPATAVAVLEAVARGEDSARTLASIVREDPGLAVEVLRTARAAFSTCRPIDSMQDALVQVGNDRLEELLRFASVGRLLRIPGAPGFSDDLGDRSRRVARTARVLAEAVGADPEAAFLAGLLHDVGLAAFHSLLPRLRVSMPVLEDLDPSHRRALADALHEEVGAGLAMEWELPHSVVGAMGYHHRPALAIVAKPQAWVVAVAVSLVDDRFGGSVSGAVGAGRFELADLGLVGDAAAAVQLRLAA